MIQTSNDTWERKVKTFNSKQRIKVISRWRPCKALQSILDFI